MHQFKTWMGLDMEADASYIVSVSRDADDSYKQMPDAEQGHPLPRLFPVSASLPNVNVLTKCRAYLTKQLTPDFVGKEQADMDKVPSFEKLHDNTVLYNSPFVSEDSGEVSNACVLKPLEVGSQRTGVLTLVATALGSGVLSLPYAFSHAGLVTGILALLVTGAASTVSLVILMMASRYTEVKSQAGLLAEATGSKAAGLVLDVFVVIYGFAALLALLIFEGDFVPAIIQGLGLPNPGRTWCILAVACAAAPPMIPTKVSSLRYIAMLVPFAVLYISATVVAQAPSYAKHGDSNQLKLFVTEPVPVLQSMCIFVFSLMCHGNAVPVVQLLDRPSVARIVKVASYVNTLLVTIYLIIGIAGYVSFQTAVQGDFLLSYPDSSNAILLCRIMMAGVCYVGIPINSSNAVQAMQKLMTAAVRREASPVVEERPVCFGLLAMLLLSVVTIGAINLTNVAMVISLVGGSLTTVQMFWIPGFIYWKMLFPIQPAGFRNVVLGTMVAGGVAGFSSVICTAVVLCSSL